ncbi:hypothetical protein CSB66_2720 [Enterobacter hormaechei]|nr:hypothetical protein CSC35_0734 [Enterobacter hormaechei]RCG81892.1 hypothetical protein CSB66_2720 [Enterobacter hormaechei]CDL31487.1 hypothetical protein [Enterobacter hormaechei]
MVKVHIALSTLGLQRALPGFSLSSVTKFPFSVNRDAGFIAKNSYGA